MGKREKKGGRGDKGREGGKEKGKKGGKEERKERQGKAGGREEGIAGLYPRLPLLAHLLPSRLPEARQRDFLSPRTAFPLVVHVNVRGE